MYWILDHCFPRAMIPGRLEVDDCFILDVSASPGRLVIDESHAEGSNLIGGESAGDCGPCHVMSTADQGQSLTGEQVKTSSYKPRTIFAEWQVYSIFI